MLSKAVRRADASRQLGMAGEEAAAGHLRTAGFRILARNWRRGRLELDMVCRDGDTLVFVEVKTRSTGSLASPAEAVTPAKRRALFQAARLWLDEHEAWHENCRFDVVCVIRHADTLTVEHIADAVDVSPFVDGSHAAWQPW